MAIEQILQRIPGAVAGSSFATGNGYNSTGQYLFVKSSGANLTYIPVSAVTDLPIGVSQNNPASSGALEVAVAGVTKIKIGSGGLTAGQEVGSDNQGKAVASAPSATGANYGQFVRGICLEGGAAGELATILLYGPYRTN